MYAVVPLEQAGADLGPLFLGEVRGLWPCGSAMAWECMHDLCDESWMRAPCSGGRLVAGEAHKLRSAYLGPLPASWKPFWAPRFWVQQREAEQRSWTSRADSSQLATGWEAAAAAIRAIYEAREA
jgi:hypothetical protein